MVKKLLLVVIATFVLVRGIENVYASTSCVDKNNLFYNKIRKLKIKGNDNPSTSVATLVVPIDDKTHVLTKNQLKTHSRGRTLYYFSWVWDKNDTSRDIFDWKSQYEICNPYLIDKDVSKTYFRINGTEVEGIILSEDFIKMLSKLIGEHLDTKDTKFKFKTKWEDYGVRFKIYKYDIPISDEEDVMCKEWINLGINGFIEYDASYLTPRKIIITRMIGV